MITYYQTLHYGKGAIVKTELEIAGRGIKKLSEGKYTMSPAALKRFSKFYKFVNLDGQAITF